MSPSLLFLLIAMQQSLLTVAWALVLWRRIEPRSTREFFAGSMLTTLSMILLAARDEVPVWIGVGLAQLCAVAATLAMRRGIQRFAYRATSARIDVLVLVASFIGVMAAADPANIRARIVVLQVTEAVVTMQAAWIIARDLKGEFGRMAARWVSAPLWIIGGLHLLRLIGVFVAPEHVAKSANEPTAGNIIFASLLMNAILVVNLSGFALIAMRAVRRLDELSRHDSMTGLLNRGAIEQALEHAIEQAKRHRTGLALLALDVDHFKRINDDHGHPAGDAVLIALAETLRAAARQGDLLARAGGEEFWVLASGIDAEGARALAERIRQAVGLQVSDHGLRVTASIGVALYQGVALEPNRRIIARADQALYLAKAGGRDRVELLSGPVDLTPANAEAPQTTVCASSPLA